MATLSKVRGYAEIAAEAVRARPFEVPFTMAKVAYANLRYDLGPDAYFLFDLDHRPMSTWRDYLRWKPHMRNVLWALHLGRGDMVKDKVLTSERCLAGGVRAVPITAIVGRDHALHPTEGRFAMLDSEAQVVAAMPDWPDRIFVKPVGGSFGLGVMAAVRDGGGWRDHEDHLLTPEALACRLLGYSAHPDPAVSARAAPGVLVQPRVPNHPALAPIGGEFGLSAARIITALTETGPEVLLAAQKIFGFPALADNFQGGFSGHLVAVVDHMTGQLRTTYGRRPGYRHLTASFDHHPRTGAAMAGFQLPYWSEVMDQARRAALAFPELPLLGHDIAIAPDGPMFLETNAYWQINLPQLAAGGLRPILADIIPRLAAEPGRKARALAALRTSARH